MRDGVTLDFSKAQQVMPTASGGVSLDFSKAQQVNQPPAQPSMWRTAYDYSGIGSLQKLAGELSGWAWKKADAENVKDLGRSARGELSGGDPGVAYNLLARRAGLVNSFLDPKNLAITGGVVAANTNPFTGIPVDAALVAHGGYGMAKNAPAAFGGNPEAMQNFLLSGAEAAGGGAGVGGQVSAVPRAAQNIVNAQGIVPKVGNAAGVPPFHARPPGPRTAAPPPTLS